MIIEDILLARGAPPLVVRDEIAIADLARLMRARSVRAAVVLGRDRKPVGLVSERAFLEAAAEAGAVSTAGDLADAAATMLEPGVTVATAFARLLAAGDDYAIVVEDDEVLGVLSLGEIARAATRASRLTTKRSGRADQGVASLASH
jgi:IMP dehydrogenase